MLFELEKKQRTYTDKNGVVRTDYNFYLYNPNNGNRIAIEPVIFKNKDGFKNYTPKEILKALAKDIQQ